MIDLGLYLVYFDVACMYCGVKTLVVVLLDVCFRLV